jgi:alpha-beta hydrolase superfamily lysophospholipase
MAAAPRDGGAPDVAIPTLVFHGERDDVVPIELARAWAAGRANVRFVPLDDGHELTATLPRILSETERWIAENLPPLP